MSYSVDLHIKLNKADVELKTLINPFCDARKKLGGDNKHNRGTFIEIRGEIKDIVQGCDLISFNNNDIDVNNFNIYNTNSATEIIIIIRMAEDNSLYLYEEPVVYIHDGDLYIGDLYFGIEQFNQIKSILDDEFVRINLSLNRRLTKDEIANNLEKDADFLNYDYDDIDYSYANVMIDGENRKILHIKDKHRGYGIKLSHFSIKSSKPKYVKKREWLDNILSIRYDDEENIVNEIDKERDNFPKHIFNELKKLYSLIFIIVILLIVLIFKM
ncbi:hypothetical protein [Acinetobacter haemolyticus]|uniref:hypothetical protein n=1 Tax=Acinetobacter haemolyticus TaxID=29430 RepID=UPI00300A408F